MRLKDLKIDRYKNSYRGRIFNGFERVAFYGKSKKEVEQKVSSYIKSLKVKISVDHEKTLNDYIYYWLTNYKLNKIEASSYSRLVSLYECRVKNQLGDYLLVEISTKMIQELIDFYANPGNDVKPLARSGLKKIKNLLNPCFEMAKKEMFIEVNPCSNVIIPVESCVTRKKKEQFTLSDSEIAILKEGCLERFSYNNELMSRNGVLILILLNLGLRVGELVSLKWEDIDFEKRIVHINKIMQVNLLVPGGERTKIKKSSKTRNGVRVLPLSDSVISYFELLKEYDSRNGIISEYVSCVPNGGITNCFNLRKSLEAIKKRKSLNKAITLHTLRHSFGSQLIRNGVGVEVVSKLLGHSSITLTYNTYIHVLQEEAAKTLKNISIC